MTQSNDRLVALRKALLARVNDGFCKYDASIVTEVLDEFAALDSVEEGSREERLCETVAVGGSTRPSPRCRLPIGHSGAHHIAAASPSREGAGLTADEWAQHRPHEQQAKVWINPREQAYRKVCAFDRQEWPCHTIRAAASPSREGAGT